MRERMPLARTAGEYAEVLSAEMVPAPEDVAMALDVQPGDLVVRRRRVTFEGETPTATSCGWFTSEVADAAPRLLQRERVREDTTRYVEMRTGRGPCTARPASAEELELLRLTGPEAVAESRHVAYCAEGRPLTYEVGISPAGRWARTEEYAMGR
ncbi:UTRA domain-containing protein [Streptomyces sp. NPDC058001]|uniref:UTRA domain-containing protein n=1 Tax=Streptomyces sp. NPDC058001 TaxID=3346300 RepID=UPI0036E3E716